MKINTDMYVRNNVTAGAILTHSINVTTGKAIIAKLTETNLLESKKIGVDKLIVNEISSPNGIITFSGNLQITNRINTDSALNTRSFILKGVRQFSLIHHDDFESSKSIEGWSKKNITSDNSMNNLLGGRCHFSYDTVGKTFDNLPEHKTLRLNALVHLFDNWSGEKLYVKVEGKVVWTRKINLNDEKHSSLNLDVLIPHESNFANISFGTTLNNKANSCDASFGIDDVMVYVK